jgi:hypothetical protein
MNEYGRFPPGVAERLKLYVYRLIDPRNGETFYVGKGKGDRVFQHARGVVEQKKPDKSVDKIGAKLQRIMAIRAAGFEVAHVIHRHGIVDAKTAQEVEAALIDAYPGLTNKVGGHGSDEFGAAHAGEIIDRYEAKPFVPTHRLVLISIAVSISEERRDSIYDATRFAWKISPKRANLAEYVLAHDRGVIVGVFKPTKPWMKATKEHFPTLATEDRIGRWGFEGIEADAPIQTQYMRKRIPDEFRKPGAANPIRFVDARAEQPKEESEPLMSSYALAR